VKEDIKVLIDPENTLVSSNCVNIKSRGTRGSMGNVCVKVCIRVYL